MKNEKRYWTVTEHNKFLDAVRKHGVNWAKIAREIGPNKKQNQVRNHATSIMFKHGRNPNYEGADVIKIIKDNVSQVHVSWTDEEHLRFL